MAIPYTVNGLAQVERLLRAIYMPQNFYCIHVDSKSPRHVHQAAAAIANCFDNVFIASRLESVRSPYIHWVSPWEYPPVITFAR